MKAWIGDRKEPPKFEAPGNIIFVSVEKGSGAPTAEGTPGAINGGVHCWYPAGGHR